ncbi:MAG: nucleotidyltransferase family protein [Desulfobacterales bacterium]|jgi:hypothetical protein
MQPIEYKILLAAGHVSPDEDQQAHLRNLLNEKFDQDRLVQLSIKEGMSALLYKSLKKAGIIGFFGHRQLQQLQSLYYSTVQHNLQIVHDLKTILRHANEKGVQVVLLQGIALLDKVYKDIGLRPLTDIDLWILPENCAVFGNLMLQLGYQQDPVYPNTFSQGKTIVDINSHILWADRIKSRQYLLSKSQRSIHDSIDSLLFQGQPAGCLNAVDQVLYLSLHAFKHSVSRLIWLVDIKQLITGWETADWKALLNRAAELGQVNIVYDLLYLLVHLFDFKLPADVNTMATGKHLPWLQRVILDKRRDGRPLPDWAPILLFSAGKDFKTRAYFVFETLFPRPAVLRQIFSDKPNFRTWQLYVIRALQLLRMAPR